MKSERTTTRLLRTTKDFLVEAPTQGFMLAAMSLECDKHPGWIMDTTEFRDYPNSDKYGCYFVLRKEGDGK